MEIYKDIEGYENLYQISNLGNVKSFQTGKEKILKPNKTKKGYLRIELWKQGKYKKYLVHRLVAQAFIPNPNLYPVVRHINDNPDDNRAENLRWGTQYDNVHDCIQRNGMNYSGMREYNNSRKTPIVATRVNDGLVRVFDSQSDASKKLGITQGNIWRALRNHGTAAGYQFAYANEEVYHE